LSCCRRLSGVERFEADEDAAHARGGGALDQVVAQDRLYCARPLEQATHAAHALEQAACEPFVAKQMIVQE